MTFTQTCNEIFNKAIADYHVKDDIETPINNPYDRDSIENRLYLKCWIDTVQWHFDASTAATRTAPTSWSKSTATSGRSTAT